MAPPFQKVCGNRCVANIIILPIGHVHCNVCYSKSMAKKSRFLSATITTCKEPMLLTIENKWLEAILCMIESMFLALPCSK
jgi:BarA-like signal transduction histidine kinase